MTDSEKRVAVNVAKNWKRGRDKDNVEGGGGWRGLPVLLACTTTKVHIQYSAHRAGEEEEEGGRRKVNNRHDRRGRKNRHIREEGGRSELLSFALVGVYVCERESKVVVRIRMCSRVARPKG